MYFAGKLTKMNTPLKTINLGFLENFAKGDRSKMIRYIEMYLKSTPKVIDDLHNEFEEKNWENLKLKAHSIKPQAQYMGVDDLRDTLIEIESIVKNNGDISRLEALIVRAKEINAMAMSELNEFISN